jgi:hypothetical protein
VVLLEETADRTPWITVLAEEFARREQDGVRQLRWRTYDKDLPGAKDLVAATTAGGVPLPALVFLEASRQLLEVAPVPATMEAVDALVQEKTGL